MTENNGRTSGDESHTFKFRGVFLPADIIYRVVSKELNRTDVLVLIVVESLVECRGAGCWATNAYLADAIGAHSMSVSISVNKLIKLGLLIRTDKNDKRYLETAWSRTTAEPVGAENDGESAPTGAPSPSAETLRGGKRKRLGGVSVSAYHNNNVKINPVKKMMVGSPPSGCASGRAAHPPQKNSFSNGSRPPDNCIQLARQLHKILRAKGKPVPPNPSMVNWGKEFSALLKRINGAEARITTVLEWYRDNEVEKPSVISAKQFCKPAVFDWLEDLVKKDLKEQHDREFSNKLTDDEAW